MNSLVPSPTPSFSLLLSTVSSDEKLGVGLGTRLIHEYTVFKVHCMCLVLAMNYSIVTRCA